MTAQKPCVLIGVTGCIAAYKSCEIVRGLQKAGVRCKVVMTEHAAEFVGPTTFRALTREPVALGLFDNPGDPIHHISLAQECDLFLIAPCTANVAAKLAHGIADDLLTTTALATKAPIVVAPAMNVAMYEAAATQENLNTLRRRGLVVLEPDEGYQACGDVGRGRMPEPSYIVEKVIAELENVRGLKADMTGVSVMVTAGPTVEAIDAVRFISNHSSGKMGYALAEAAAARGAAVTLISGPVSLEAPEGVELVPVKSAREMLAAAQEPFMSSDLAIFAAAVADYRPAAPSDKKLKKGVDDASLTSISLIENPDILKTLASKKENRYVVGFAAETDDVLENGRVKLERKHADMIVANRVGEGLAFGTDDNAATLIMETEEIELARMQKSQMAHEILSAALKDRERKLSR
ncbi:MAG: bifunctional phosphopantothenoylcysteine decarboxylase/phosphopantothenate--cysteine ligase CoaBC [Eggerthellaceae bacterium]|nr:bifunctional phosphopantothenoylcysteine decarboxylase/phosphopantothenate--cysteine ligase CoaBC [Eggerthellaceae bacterium]